MKDNIVEIAIAILVALLVLKFLGIFGILVGVASFYLGKMYGTQVESTIQNFVTRIKSYF